MRTRSEPAAAIRPAAGLSAYTACLTTGPLRAWSLLALTLLLLSAIALLFGDGLTERFLGHLNAHGHSHLHAHGHPFIDARPLGFIPNAADTLSNAVFLIPGLLGLFAMAVPGALRGLSPVLRSGLAVFFVGLLLTALGSGVYHWAPSGPTLALDRLGMAVAFAGVLTVATAERLSLQGAVWMLRLSLPLALLAATLPAFTGNVLPWGVVQGGGIVWVLLLALLRRPLSGSLGVSLGAVIAWYAVAKVLEGADTAVFAATGEWVSGHTLKHVAAAGAAWPLVAALRRHARGTVSAA
jgi:hypothetical protein